MNSEIKIATRQSYGEALVELGKKNKNVVVLDADLSSATKTSMFAKQFPERFMNVGIAEQNLMGIAAGLSTFDKIPYASTFAVFAAGRAYDQVRNSICYPNLNVKICATHAGVTVGEDGATHQMLEDLSMMRTLPNMKVFCPSDDIQTKWLIQEISKYAFQDCTNLSIIRFSKATDSLLLIRSDYLNKPIQNLLLFNLFQLVKPH